MNATGRPLIGSVNMFPVSTNAFASICLSPYDSSTLTAPCSLCIVRLRTPENKAASAAPAASPITTYVACGLKASDPREISGPPKQNDTAYIAPANTKEVT